MTTGKEQDATGRKPMRPALASVLAVAAGLAGDGVRTSAVPLDARQEMSDRLNRQAMISYLEGEIAKLHPHDKRRKSLEKKLLALKG